MAIFKSTFNALMEKLSMCDVWSADQRKIFFAALAEAYGAWSVRAATTDEFKDALVAAQGRSGLRLIHCTIDIEQLAASGASVSGLRGR